MFCTFFYTFILTKNSGPYYEKEGTSLLINKQLLLFSVKKNTISLPINLSSNTNTWQTFFWTVCSTYTKMFCTFFYTFILTKNSGPYYEKEGTSLLINKQLLLFSVKKNTISLPINLISNTNTWQTFFWTVCSLNVQWLEEFQSTSFDDADFQSNLQIWRVFRGKRSSLLEFDF